MGDKSKIQRLQFWDILYGYKSIVMIGFNYSKSNLAIEQIQSMISFYNNWDIRFSKSGLNGGAESFVSREKQRLNGHQMFWMTFQKGVIISISNKIYEFHIIVHFQNAGLMPIRLGTGHAI